MNKLLGNLKLWQKIGLILAAFALPLSFSGYLNLHSFQENIAMGEQELSGLDLLRPLGQLLHLLSHRQILAAKAYRGEKGLADEMALNNAEIDKTVDALDQAQRRTGSWLKLGTDATAPESGRINADNIRNEWQYIKSQDSLGAPGEHQSLHTKLLTDSLAMIGQISDASGLELDPALDTFYLRESAIQMMPELQVETSRLLQRALDTTAGPSPEKIVNLTNSIALVRDGFFPRLTHALEAALREDAAFFGTSESLQRELPPRLDEFKKSVAAVVETAGQIAAGQKETGDIALLAACERLATAATRVSETATQELTGTISSRLTHFRRQRLETFGITITALLLAALFTWGIVRNTTRRLHHLAEAAQATAVEGDLSHVIASDGSDEIGTLAAAFSQMVSHLCTLTGQVQNAAIIVNTSVSEIAATSKQQETTTCEVAATTTQIGATSKEIYATSKELVKTVNQVSEVAQETATLATSGHVSLARMEETMGMFIQAVSTINSKLAVLSEKAANINQVVITITKVADQTNLLSLNAAIEAEKAGEYGRGFTVVATEIRRLADQTAVATLDIEQMVKEMQSAVSAGVMGMDKFGEQVRSGVSEVQQVSGQLAQIIQQVQTLSPRFAVVNEGMQAQATGADQITQALVQLTEATRQAAESLRLSNINVDQLHDASRGMLRSLEGFKLRAA